MAEGSDNDYLDAVWDLYNAAGRPSYVELADRIRANNTSAQQPPTQDVIGKVIRGKELSRWSTVSMIFGELHRYDLFDNVPSVADLQRLWTKTKDGGGKTADVVTSHVDRERIDSAVAERYKSGDVSENEATARWESLFTIQEQLDLDATGEYERGTGALVSTRKVDGSSYGWTTLHPRVCERQGGKLTMGRDVDNDIRYDHVTVSRRHAQLNFVRAHDRVVWMITDLGSTNGVSIDYEQIPPLVPFAIVEPGTRINMGNFELVYVDYEKWSRCSGEQKNTILGIQRWAVE